MEMNNTKQWKCEYCNNEYKSKGNLIYHQKHGKKCLTIQHQNTQYNNIEDIHKSGLLYQKKYYENIIGNIKEEYEERLSNLQKDHEKELTIRDEKERKIVDDCHEKIESMLMKLASKPTSVTNNNNRVLNMSILNTDEDEFETYFKSVSNEINNMDDLVEKLCVKFTDKNGNLQYICTDPSRNMFKFKDKNNVLQKDPNATNLISIIQTPLNKTIKFREHDLLKVLGDHKYNNTYEQKDAEDIYNSLYGMKNLNRKDSNTELCKSLVKKCS
jgi:hypothetical protein